MADPLALTPGMQEFIENMGLFFERFDLPRIAGRILGLLLLASRPLTLDDMADALQVSRASASTNARMAVAFGMAEQVGVPGDRRDYYRWPDDGWGTQLNLNIEALKAIAAIVNRGLDALTPDDDVARVRLEEAREFCAFLDAEMKGMLERWGVYRRQLRQESSGASEPMTGTDA